MPQIDSATIKTAFSLPPQAAMEYYKGKGYRFSWNWQDTWQEAHAKAFTVAKVMRMDVLQDIRGMVTKSLKEGITFRQFRKELEPRLKAKGWWGMKFIAGPDGKTEKIWEGTPRRLRTIYQTNLQTAYMAGRYRNMEAVKKRRPFWQYIAIRDSKTRASHRILNGKIFRHDDPFWKTHFPPNGYNCRCRARSISERELKRDGLDGKVESTKGKMSTEQKLVSKKTGEVAEVAVYTDPLTGKTMSPDTGWNYNPGRAAWQPDLNKYDYDIAKQYIEGAVTGPAFTRLFEGKDKGNFPVAVLNEDYRKTIKAKTQVVHLSGETLVKNKGEIKGIKGHPELTITDYQKLPEVISKAQLIVQDGDLTLVFIRKNKKIYHAAIKSTKSGKALFVTSFRHTDIEDVERIKQKGKILKDEL